MASRFITNAPEYWFARSSPAMTVNLRQPSSTVPDITGTQRPPI
jgi:hypothetical protein